MDAVIFVYALGANWFCKRMSMLLTSLVLDLQGQALQIIAVDIARLAGELEVSSQSGFASLDV